MCFLTCCHVAFAGYPRSAHHPATPLLPSAMAMAPWRRWWTYHGLGQRWGRRPWKGLESWWLGYFHWSHTWLEHIHISPWVHGCHAAAGWQKKINDAKCSGHDINSLHACWPTHRHSIYVYTYGICRHIIWCICNVWNYETYSYI